MLKAIVLAARMARAVPASVRFVLPLAVMLALYWLSSLPGKPLPDDPALYSLFYWVSPEVQNTLHVPAYATLSAAWRWALETWRAGPRARSLTALIVASLYGLSDEWHQSFVPGRYASATDVAFDVAGAIVGLWVADWARRRYRL